jgi:glycosyltransferase involved in cell wall biosynthesis
MNRFSCVRKFYRDLEARTVEISSGLVTASPPITEYFLSRYKAPRVMTVLNGYDPDDFRGIPEHPAVRRQYFNMVFTGKFSASDVTCRISPFVEALSAAAEEDPEGARRFRLHLAGQLTASEKRLFRKLFLSGLVVIHGECSRDEALSFQNSADMFLLITSIGRSSVITSKVFEYVYFQKPILALTHHTQAAEMIAPMDDSEVIHPEDIGGITAFFRSLFREITDRKRHRKNRGYRDRFSFENSASSLDQFLKNILKKD